MIEAHAWLIELPCPPNLMSAISPSTGSTVTSISLPQSGLYSRAARSEGATLVLFRERR